MGFYHKWTPSKTAKREFAQKMDEISEFCAKNGIQQSRNGDSYYFTIKGKNYRVSNHSVEASNAHAYNWLGEQSRDLYHPGGRKDDVIYIHASKTRIMDIYNDLKSGKKLDGRGNVIENTKTLKAVKMKAPKMTNSQLSRMARGR